jgi:hypothetical protein
MIITGEYLLQKKTEKGKILEQTIVSNLITDFGLDFLKNETTVIKEEGFKYCSVGGGTTPPKPSDTQLEKLISTKIKNPNPVGEITTEYGQVSFEYSWGTGELGDCTISELSVGTVSNILSRCLLKDVNGNPKVFRITSDEGLTIIYTLKIFPFLQNNATKNITVSYKDEIIPVTLTGLLSPFYGVGSEAVKTVLGGQKGLNSKETLQVEVNTQDKTKNHFTVEHTTINGKTVLICKLPVFTVNTIEYLHFYTFDAPYNFKLVFSSPLNLEEEGEEFQIIMENF